MGMDSELFSLRTGNAPTVLDITHRLARFVEGKGDGLLSVLIPHSTAGLAVMEVGDRSELDLLEYLSRGMFEGHSWRHRHGSPGHGADHIIPAFISPSLVLPVEDGYLPLGTWQSVVVVDTNGDNPVRSLRLTFLPA